MKCGETSILLIRCDIEDISLVEDVIFTIKGIGIVTKAYPEEVTYKSGYFYIAFTQEDTITLSNGKSTYCYIEGQINFKDKAVLKTNTERFQIKGTLATKVVEGNRPSPEPLENISLIIEDNVVVAKVETEGIENIVNELVESKEFATQSQLEKLATSKDVNIVAENLIQLIKTKADATLLETKADLVLLDSKADTKDLKSKADISELEKKADITALELKADITALESKADISLLSTLADKEETESEIATVSLRVDDVVSEISDTKARTDDNEQKIVFLSKMAQGQIYDFVESEQSGISEPPKGAEYMSLLEFKGNSEQFTTKGYNKYYASRGYATERVSFESNRDTYTVKILDASKEWFINGYATDTGHEYNDTFGTKIYVGSSTKLKANVKSDVPIRVLAFFFDSSSKLIGWTNSVPQNASNQNEYSIPSGTEFATIRLSMSAEKMAEYKLANGSTIEFSVCISLDENANNIYEPYTGGKPSPNPDYPQEISGIEELNIKVYKSRNLVSEYLPNKHWDVAGVEADCVGRARINPIYTSGNITISGDTIEPVSVFGRIMLNGKLLGTTSFYQLSSTNKKVTIETSLAHDCILMNFMAHPNASDQTKVPVIDNLMVEFGEVAHEYEPYRDADSRKIVPPRAMHKVSGYADTLSVEQGKWIYANKKIKFSDFYFNNVTKWQTNYTEENGIMSFRINDVTMNPNSKFSAGKKNADALSNVVHGIFQWNYDKVTSTSIFMGIAGGFIITAPKEMFGIEEWTTDQAITIPKTAPICQGYGIYPLDVEETEDINADDLAWLKSLQGIEANTIQITDQNGKDVNYLVEYIVKLSEATGSEA